MPIGKNALKRVENNGYSKVETQAPDMENSTVIANIDQQVVEKILAPVEKKAKAKAANKATPVEAVAEAPAVEAKPAKRKYVKRKVATEAPVVEAKPAKRKYVKRRPSEKKTEGKAGFDRVEVGQGMPYYLL